MTDRLPFCQLQDLAHGAPNLRHQGGGQASQLPSCEAPIIDGPELVHEQIGRLPQTSGSRVSRFIRSTARRMYAARESFSATAHRLLASSRSSGSLREMALIAITARR